MKQQPVPEAVEVPIDQIMPFVSRSRDRAEFEQMKDSIRKYGQQKPVGLRDISHLPPDKRRRPGGGHYRYQRVWGEGRIMAATELGRSKVLATIGSMSEADVVGFFLAENIVREPLPWAEKAKLVKLDLDAGLSHEQVAKQYCLTTKHVAKLERILGKTARGLEEEVSRMSMNDAEVFSTLPEGEQAIVIETMRETGEREIQSIVRKAREVTAGGEQLSKTALKKSIESVEKQLAKQRGKMKVLRLHWGLGPQNLALLLKDPKIRKAAESEGVPFKKFEKITQ